MSPQGCLSSINPFMTVSLVVQEIKFLSINKDSNKCLPHGVWFRVAWVVRTFEIKAYEGFTWISKNIQTTTFSILLNDCFDEKQICLCP